MTAHRYIARMIHGPLAVLLIVFGLLSSVTQLSRLGDALFGAMSNPWTMAELSLYVAPVLAGVALPMALLLACHIGYDRLADSGELFAFAACGVTARRLFRPALSVAAPVTLASLLIGIYGVPWGVARFVDTMADAATRSFAETVQPRTFTEVLGATAFYAGDVDPTTGAWRRAFMAHAVPETGRQLLLFSPDIEVVPHPKVRAAVLRIAAGQALLLGEDPSVVESVRFGDGEGLLDLQQWSAEQADIYYAHQAHDVDQLLQDIELEARPKQRAKISFFLWQKLALPFACFPLAVIGALLGSVRSSTRRARAYVLSVLWAVLFFVGHEGARGLAIRGVLPASLAAWVAVIVATLLALLLWWWRAGLRR